MNCRALFVFTLGLMMVPLAHAELQITALEVGVFEDKSPDFGSDAILISGHQQAVRPSREIVASLGTQFGIRYSVSGKIEGENPVTLLYLTPGIIDPQGEQHDLIIEHKNLSATSASHTMAFKITEAYELVPGTWRMMIFEKNRKLAEARFEVLIKGTQTLSKFKEIVPAEVAPKQ